MRMNPDDKTVAAMDLLVPKVGELIGGSQREERLQVCCTAMHAVRRCLGHISLSLHGACCHAVQIVNFANAC